MAKRFLTVQEKGGPYGIDSGSLGRNGSGTNEPVQEQGAAYSVGVFRYLLIIGITFIIIYPIISKFSVAFKDKQDIYNPTIYMIPVHFTLDNFKLVLDLLDYWPLLLNTMIYVFITMLLTTMSTALAGYGFARFTFPGSNLLFGLVVLTILIPMSTLMVPMYLHFRSFDILGLVHMFTGKKALTC